METIVWIGRVVRKDTDKGQSLVLIRGVFRREDEARRMTPAFGCDALVVAKSGQYAELGSLVVVALTQMEMES